MFITYYCQDGKLYFKVLNQPVNCDLELEVTEEMKKAVQEAHNIKSISDSSLAADEGGAVASSADEGGAAVSSTPSSADEGGAANKKSLSIPNDHSDEISIVYFYKPI